MNLKFLVKDKNEKNMFLKLVAQFVTEMRHCADYTGSCQIINYLKPELFIVIFIHYKPRITGAILDLYG